MIYIKLQNCCVPFFEVYFEGGTPKLYTNQLKDVCNEVDFFDKNFCFSVFLTNFYFPEKVLKTSISIKVTVYMQYRRLRSEKT